MNASQVQATQWNNGPLLLLAGPGSGKTRVLTYRIASILDQSEGQHFKLLALTFTNKAAAEMQQRVEKLVPQQFGRVRLTTFHSYAAEMLRQHGSHIQTRPDFQILSHNEDREMVLDEAIREAQKIYSFQVNSRVSGQSLLPFINRALDYCLSEQDVLESLKKQIQIKLMNFQKFICAI